MTHKDIFESLARNAFDFLERGISEFDEAPKYSVIHFCAAVEMILKARLMQEHWSLIVSKPEQANLEKFMAGNFVSVTLDEARARLRDIAGENIPDDAFKSFRALANHRNKMVHFFHADLNNSEQKKEQIVVEHCRSWFHLHRLLNQWDSYFADFSSEIKRADNLMKKHRKYLRAKFKALKNELDDCRAKGLKPKSCSACGFKAAIPDEIATPISINNCMVCDFSETQVEITCQHCSRLVVVAGEGYAKCPGCGGKIEPGDIAQALCHNGGASPGIHEDDYQCRYINCGQCEGYHTVIVLDNGYFCVQCFELSDRVQDCEWCNDPNTGDMEDSYFVGCGICEGKGGWDDKD